MKLSALIPALILPLLLAACASTGDNNLGSVGNDALILFDDNAPPAPALASSAAPARPDLLAINTPPAKPFPGTLPPENLHYQGAGAPPRTASQAETAPVPSLPPRSVDNNTTADSDNDKPAAKPKPKPKPRPTTKPAYTYVIRQGDTLTAIARKFGLPVSRLLAANNGDSLIRPGQTLRIYPGGKATAETASARKPGKSSGSGKSSSSNKSSSSGSHTVRQGETLWSIAKRNGTTPDRIKSLNDLDTTNIRPGQKLRIP